MLIKDGLVTPAQVDEAVNSQVVFGGRLGTNLIELEYIDERTLTRALSKLHGVPSVEPEVYPRIDPNTIKAIPRKIAAKYKVIPVNVEGKKLDLLMMDPSNFGARDEIGFTTGYVVKPLVAPEVRILSLLEKYYGIKRDLRYITLSVTDTKEFLKREHPAKPPPAKVKKSSPAERKKPSPLFKKTTLTPLAEGEELTSPEEFERLTRAMEGETAADAEPEEILTLTEEIGEERIPGAPVPEPPPPDLTAETHVISPETDEEEEVVLEEEIPEEEIKPLSLKEAADALEEVEDRDDIARIILGFALSYFKRTALLTVKSDLVFGWYGLGQDLNKQVVERIMIPLNAPSVFKLVCDSCGHYLGPSPPNPINERFLKLMGGVKPNSFFLIPILVKGKVVNILYGDNGEGKDAPFDISELLILAQKIPQTFENLIIKRKKLTS
ncbi:MAG: hypothetical protein JSU92_10905 [Deltaproteobacteria bacterium]|nr:MAG: hypothetical protein JSU92_10905 [Deltaproteobacteria bacterium]